MRHDFFSTCSEDPSELGSVCSDAAQFKFTPKLTFNEASMPIEHIAETITPSGDVTSEMIETGVDAIARELKATLQQPGLCTINIGEGIQAAQGICTWIPGQFDSGSRGKFNCNIGSCRCSSFSRNGCARFFKPCTSTRESCNSFPSTAQNRDLSCVKTDGLARWVKYKLDAAKFSQEPNFN